MITNQKIIDEVKKLIAEKYPDCALYIDKVPDGSVRPYFLIAYVSDETVSINKSTTSETLFLNVIYFGAVDEHGMTNAAEKQEALKELKLIFRRGYIKTEDRAIPVKIKGKAVDGEAAVEIIFEYYEQRTDEAAEAELMEEIDINQNVN